MEGTRDPGRLGERIAAHYLELSGYEIIDTNVRAARAEIDLVAGCGGCLAFVEVKCRRGASFGGAINAVTGEKRRRLRRGARAYLAGGGPGRRFEEYRFDLIAIDLDSDRDTMTLMHLKGIA